MRAFVWIAMITSLAGAQSAWASNAALADFFGQWVGSGAAKVDGAETQSRDTDVEISKAQDGFKISWSTMRTEKDDQSQSVVKATSLTFRGTAKPTVFHGADSGDPTKGKKAVWAVITGKTLKISQFMLSDEGKWTMQVYERTLTTATDMDSKFTRFEDGKIARQAELKLKKAP